MLTIVSDRNSLKFRGVCSHFILFEPLKAYIGINLISSNKSSELFAVKEVQNKPSSKTRRDKKEKSRCFQKKASQENTEQVKARSYQQLLLQVSQTYKHRYLK